MTATETKTEQVQALADELGFECMGLAPASALIARPEVRDMCASGKCQKYGTSWACPPACPSIEEFQAMYGTFDQCLVVQTVGELEDEFDGEAMMDAAEQHGKRVYELASKVADLDFPTMCLSAGTCMLCPTCTYPDAPCRFPEKRLVSMEASGLVVSDVCQAARIPYNHGKLSIAYSSCILF